LEGNMKPIQSAQTLFSFLMITAVLLAGCMPVAPTPLPAPTHSPTQTLTAGPTQQPTITVTPLPSLTPTPSGLDLSGAVLQALEAAAVDSFSAQVEVQTSLKETRISAAKVMKETRIEESLQDLITRVAAGDGWNLHLHRSIQSAGSSTAGDLLWVNDQVFARREASGASDAGQSFPTGWVRYTGLTSDAFWPAFTGLHFAEDYETLASPWILLAGEDTGLLRDALLNHLLESAYQPVTLADGSHGLQITLRIQHPGAAGTLKGVNWYSPALRTAFSTPQEARIVHHFVLDAAGQMQSWERNVEIDIRSVELDGLPGEEPGSRVSVSGTQHLKMTFTAENPMTPNEPAKSQRAASLAFYSQVPDLKAPFQSLEEFDLALSAALAGDSLENFWSTIHLLRQMPLIFGDRAVFLYRGEAGSVAWNGDWGEIDSATGSRQVTPGARLGLSDLWLACVTLPMDARMEYTLVVDGQAGLLDPLNPLVEEGGLGSSSTFGMPDYLPPAFLAARSDAPRGELSEDQTIQSASLGYSVHYKVYTPAGYAKLKNLPVLYVTDGPDFLTFGKMVTALDNLIADGQVRPIIAVFIDPRDIVTGQNRREAEFLDNPKYHDFLSRELSPTIEFKYRAERKPESRALMGASYGGYHAAQFALAKYAKFGLIGMLSPSLWVSEGAVLQAYRDSPVRSLKFFLSTGAYSDNTAVSREMKTILEEKGYPLLYLESSEGHSYANWRDKLDDLLIFFFGK
jgi:enterochelin esterase-like enzyme